MSAVQQLAPECERCGGPVKLEVRFQVSGNALYGRCTGDCGRAGWLVTRGTSP